MNKVINSFEKFNGKKFRATGELVDCGLDKYTNERVYKDEFEMTISYAKHLQLKRLNDLDFECRILKHKLEMQQQEYNEIDPIDLGEYHYKLNEYYRLLAIVTR